MLTWLFDEDSFASAAKLTATGQAQSVVCDHLGTPLSLHDGQGQRTWELSLDSYGGVRQGRGRAQDCPFRYQGQYEDVETGLYYNRFRYFDPQAGQYISQDPIRIKGGSQLYGYVHNPKSWVDIFGLSGENPFDYLKQALKRQGLQTGDPIPSNFKEKWVDATTANKYEVRMQLTDPNYGKSEDIFRVNRKQLGLDVNGQEKGLEYLDENGVWHRESTLKSGSATQPNLTYNPQTTADTHIGIPSGFKVSC